MESEFTHHQGHAGKFYGGIGEEQSAHQLPAVLTLELATGHDDDERDEGGELYNGGKGEQEARTAPHGAEELVVGAVVVIGERPTCRIATGGTAVVQTQVVVEGRVGIDIVNFVVEPMRRQYGHDGQYGCCREVFMLAMLQFLHMARIAVRAAVMHLRLGDEEVQHQNPNQIVQEDAAQRSSISATWHFQQRLLLSWSVSHLITRWW